MENDKKSNGAFIGAIVVIIIIIVGAIYMWNKQEKEVEPVVDQVSEDATVLNAYEELNSIEGDVNVFTEEDLGLDQSIQ